jgi:hypothetical protein
MSEPMTVHIECWPVAADDAGIWLLSGRDALRTSLPVAADTGPDAEAKLLLAGHDLLDDLVLGHFTSWHIDGSWHVDTYIAVIHCAGYVRERWPDAEPISAALAEAVGRPPTHGATEAPTPRYIDTLLHGLRHLRLLLDYDATAAAVMPTAMRRALEPLTPALAGLYDEEHQAA